MECLVERFLFRQVLTQDVDMLRSDTVCPQPFLKVHRIHVNNLFEANRNGRLFLFLLILFGFVTVNTKQGAGTKHIVPAIEAEEFER